MRWVMQVVLGDPPDPRRDGHRARRAACRCCCSMPARATWQLAQRHHALLASGRTCEHARARRRREAAPPAAAALVGELALLVPMAGLIEPRSRAAAPRQATAEDRAGARPSRAPSSPTRTSCAARPPTWSRRSARGSRSFERARAATAAPDRTGAQACRSGHAMTRLDDGTRGRSSASSSARATQVRLCLACLLARGHLLIEDVPGVGKTTLAHTPGAGAGPGVAAGAVHQRPAAGRHRRRVDLRPRHAAIPVPRAARCSRSCCWPMRSTAPAPRRRARCSRRWRSARSASMASRYPLPEPFFVVATQNPHEQIGTYRPARIAARSLPDARDPGLSGSGGRAARAAARASGASC